MRDWTVNDRLKVPTAIDPYYEVKLWFKAQAVYMAIGGGSLSNAHSLHVDIRDLTPPQFVASLGLPVYENPDPFLSLLSLVLNPDLESLRRSLISTEETILQLEDEIFKLGTKSPALLKGLESAKATYFSMLEAVAQMEREQPRVPETIPPEIQRLLNAVEKGYPRHFLRMDLYQLCQSWDRLSALLTDAAPAIAGAARAVRLTEDVAQSDELGRWASAAQMVQQDIINIDSLVARRRAEMEMEIEYPDAEGIDSRIISYLDGWQRRANRAEPLFAPLAAELQAAAQQYLQLDFAGLRRLAYSIRNLHVWGHWQWISIDGVSKVMLSMWNDELEGLGQLLVSIAAHQDSFGPVVEPDGSEAILYQAECQMAFNDAYRVIRHVPFEVVAGVDHSFAQGSIVISVGDNNVGISPGSRFIGGESFNALDRAVRAGKKRRKPRDLVVSAEISMLAWVVPQWRPWPYSRKIDSRDACRRSMLQVLKNLDEPRLGVYDMLVQKTTPDRFEYLSRFRNYSFRGITVWTAASRILEGITSAF